MQRVIDSIPYFPLDRGVQARYAELRHWAKPASHPIYQKEHTADRWIAATAMAYDLPLASADHVFEDIPGLRLVAPETPAA